MKHYVWIILLWSGAAQAADAPTCNLQGEVTILGAANAESTVGVFKPDGTVLAEIKGFDAGKVAYACAWETRFNLLWVRYNDALVLLDPGELKLAFKTERCVAAADVPTAPASRTVGSAAGVGCKDKAPKNSKERAP